MKLFGTLFFIATMAFLLFVVVASTPVGRINRACMPVAWGGKAMTTAARIMNDSWKEPVQTWMDKGHQSCRFFIFENFYADEWARQKAAASAASTQREK